MRNLDTGHYHCTAFLGRHTLSHKLVNIFIQMNEGCSGEIAPWKDRVVRIIIFGYNVCFPGACQPALEPEGLCLADGSWMWLCSRSFSGILKWSSFIGCSYQDKIYSFILIVQLQTFLLLFCISFKPLYPRVSGIAAYSFPTEPLLGSALSLHPWWQESLSLHKNRTLPVLENLIVRIHIMSLSTVSWIIYTQPDVLDDASLG